MRRFLPSLFIGLGLTIAFGPALVIRVVDDWIARAQQADVTHVLDQSQYAPPVRSTTRTEVIRPGAVIAPGSEGYVLEIPKIGVRVIIRELEPFVFSGRNTPMLKRHGAGQVPYTNDLKNVSPGADGTAAIAGHRTTAGAPFRDIDRLGSGDVILIRKGSFEQVWVVVYSTAVVPSAVAAIRSSSGARRLAILTCNPPFSASERLIVYATLLEEMGN